MTDLPQILIGEFVRTTEMFLAWFKRFDLKRSTSGEQILDFMQSWVPALLVYTIQFKQNSKNFFRIRGENFIFCRI